MMKEKIFCAFSGGGYRATFFHAGVLRRLICFGLKDRIKLISSVSGGSIVSGLFCLHYDEIQSVADYDKLVLEPLIAFSRRDVRRRMVGYRFLSIFQDIMARLALIFGKWGGVFAFLRGKSNSELMMEYLNRELFRGKTMADLSKGMKLTLNATNLNTGARWRFKQEDFGDYKTGYSKAADRVPLAFAVTASACFPGLFSPLKMGVAEYGFSGGKLTESSKGQEAVYLADGGIYDNFGYYGLESELARGEDAFFIISDAARVFENDGGKYNLLNEAPRIINILMEQISNRDRKIIMDKIADKSWQGIYMKLEHSCSYYRAFGEGAKTVPQVGWPDEVVDRIAQMRTDLNYFSDQEVEALVCHGETLIETNLAKWYPEDYMQMKENAPAGFFAEIKGREREIYEALANSHKMI